jgi:hypothetical protein
MDLVKTEDFHLEVGIFSCYVITYQSQYDGEYGSG